MENPTIERLTTETLGLAEAKAQDLRGYIFKPDELQDAAMKTLIAAGVSSEDIRCIKVGSKDGELKIIADLYPRALKKKDANEHDRPKFKNNKLHFPEAGTDDDENYNSKFFKALYNKIYHNKKKHLNLKKVNRIVLSGNNAGKMKTFIEIEFDPYIFIAFAYNIPFIDRFYKISVTGKKFKSREEIEDLPKDERKKLMKLNSEYKSDGLALCTTFVTFSAKPVFDPAIGEHVDSFHPDQVDRFYKKLDD